jgi:AcrR family transcriptional regulator
VTKAALNPDGIFRAALTLVDTEGLDALTMRRLAADLGVATMSLYGHVPNKDDLLTGLVNLATSEIALPPRDTPPWDALRTIIRDFRRVALVHPNLVPLIVRQPPTGAAGLQVLEAALHAMRRAGLDSAAAVRTYRVTASYAIGFVSLECGRYFEPVDPSAGDQIAPIDLTSIPTIIDMASELLDWNADEEFEAGLDLLISVLSRPTAEAGLA